MVVAGKEPGDLEEASSPMEMCVGSEGVDYWEHGHGG